ncbi:MAG: HAD-IA family hydrolase [Dorea sp.]|jgi:FMN phosphatase YigB (HAD superfamily)|nr:HAD-IA family hydrolase [Dorea sp.]
MELYSDYPCLTEEFLREQVDAAIFDIGNVLIDFAWQDYMKSLDFDRVTYEHVADAMFRSEDWDQGDLGRITTKEWLNLFIENDPEYEDAIRRTFSGFGAAIIPYDFSEEWISYFRKHGIKLYFLSNYSEEMYRQSKDRLSFLDGFDGGIFSWKEKCMKPDAKIYQLLLERYKINPKKALFFDDRRENVEAFEAFGVHGVIFHRDIPLQMLQK